MGDPVDRADEIQARLFAEMSGGPRDPEFQAILALLDAIGSILPIVPLLGVVIFVVTRPSVQGVDSWLGALLAAGAAGAGWSIRQIQLAWRGRRKARRDRARVFLRNEIRRIVAATGGFPVEQNRGALKGSTDVSVAIRRELLAVFDEVVDALHSEGYHYDHRGYLVRVDGRQLAAGTGAGTVALPAASTPPPSPQPAGS